MALTKVGPAGIGSTPGTGYVIGDSFLHSTGLDSTNAKFTGIVTAQTFRVLGNFQVDGTTTTLDTEITSVDKLEVGANNTTVGVAITQSGTGDILNLYDGSTEVFSVRDGGNVGIKNATGLSEFPVDVGGEIASKNANKEFIGINLVNNEARIRSSFFSGASGAYRPITFYTSDAERLRITSGGFITQKFTSNNSTTAEGLFINNLNNGTGNNASLILSNDSGERKKAAVALIDTGNYGAGDLVFALDGADSGNLHLTNDEKLRITSAGLVGIGTNSPTGKLEVAHDSQTDLLKLKRTSGNTGTFTISLGGANPGTIFSTSGVCDDFVFIAGSERLRIASDGKVGIGTNSPATQLHVRGSSVGSILRLTGNSNTAYGEIEGDNVGNLIFNADPGNAGNSSTMRFRVDGTERLRIDSSGRLLKSGQASLTSTSLNHPIQVAAASDANAIVIFGRASDDIGELSYYEADKSTRLGELQYRQDHVNFRHRKGDIRFYTHPTGGTSERVRIRSQGPHLLIGTGGDATYNEITESSSNAGLVIGSGSMGNGGIVIRNSSSGTGRIYFADNSGNDTGRQRGQINYYHDGDYMMFATASTERMRITSGGDVRISSGDLVVGETTDSNAGSQTISVGSITSGAGGIQLWGNPTNGNSFIQFGDGTAGASHYRGYINYRHADDGLRFGTAGSDRVIINSAGNLGLNETVPYYKIHMVFNNATTSLTGGNSGAWGSDGIRIENTNTTVGSMALAHFRNYDADWHIGSKRVASNNSSFIFSCEGSTRVQIDNGGRVKIGDIADPEAVVTDCPVYIDMHSDITAFNTAEGAANYGFVRLEETGSNNNRYHGIELRNRNSGDIRIMNLDVNTSDRGDLVFAMPDGGASTGLHFKTRFNSVKSSLQIAGKNGATLANSSTEHVDVYISTKTQVTGVESGAGAEIAGLIRFEDKGGTNSRYHGLELRNRNSGDARILNLDEGTTNKSNMVFAVDNGSTLIEALKIHSGGQVTKPLQPSFQVTGFPSHRYMNSWNTVDLSAWNYVDVNVGSHFNNSNGRFTAPVAGKYMFIWTSMYSNPSTNDFANILLKNGNALVVSNNHSGGGNSNGHQWNDCTAQSIITMAVGDYVTAQSTGSNSSTCYLYGSSSSRYNSFSGFLIG